MHLADSGSLSATARELNLPKSSVSRLLARLETDVGQALFERSTRHFRLNDAGVIFRQYANQVVDTLMEAQAALDGLTVEPQGVLRVNTTPSFAQGLIAPVLPGYLDRYPKVSVNLTTDVRDTDMIHDGIDVAIRIGALAESVVPAARLPSIGLWLCASPEYLDRNGSPADIEEVSGHHCVARELRPTWTFRKGPAERIIRPTARAALSDAAAQKVVVEDGGGIGCLPSYVIESSLRAGKLVRVLPQWRRAPIDIHAVFPRHHVTSAKVRSFLDTLAGHLRQLEL